MRQDELEEYKWIIKNIKLIVEIIEKFNPGNYIWESSGVVTSNGIQIEYSKYLIETHKKAKNIEEAINKLPEKEKTLITLRYIENNTMKNVGKMMGYSLIHVNRIHKKALKLLEIS